MGWVQETLDPALPVFGQNPACSVAGFARARRRFTPHFHRDLPPPSEARGETRALPDAGRPLAPGRLRGVFTSSESRRAFQRETIQQAFGAPVLDRYGVSEFCVSMTECHERHLHTDMELCMVEVEVEEETESWERGPLPGTGLATEATPFLRYRVGAVAEAQGLQETPAALRVRVVRRARCDEASERGLRKEFRMRLGDEIRIDLDYLDSIPREPNGKFRAVQSAVGRPTAGGGRR